MSPIVDLDPVESSGYVTFGNGLPKLWELMATISVNEKKLIYVKQY